MYGTYSVKPEGAKCAASPAQVFIKDVAHAKLMCVEVSLQITRADAGTIDIPIHIFPELGMNIDPSSVTIYQLQNDKFERTVDPNQGPWGIDSLIYPFGRENSIVFALYSKVNEKQKLGQQFTVSFSQKVTFSDKPNLEIIFPNIADSNSQVLTITSSDTIKDVGDSKVLNQFTIQEISSNGKASFKIVKFAFPQPPPNISPESIKCFIAVPNSPTYQVKDSTITTEFDGHTVLSCSLSNDDLRFDLLLAGKQVPQQTVQGDIAITPGTEYIFKKALSNGNFQNTRVSFTGSNDLRGIVKISPCLDASNYRNAKVSIVGRTRLSLESITTLEMQNVVAGVNGIANVYIERVLEKRNVDPISARVLLFNKRNNEFQIVSPIETNQVFQISVDDLSRGVTLGIFMDQQSQEDFTNLPIYIDYAKDSYFDFDLFKINVFTTQIIDTIERIPTYRPHFSVVHSRQHFDYLQLEILGSFMVLAKQSFGTSLAIKVTIPRTQKVLQQFSGYLTELKCIYVMKDGMLSNMFKYSEASVVYSPESKEYQLLCNEDFGDYEYHVLIAAPKYKSNDYFVSFEHYVTVHGSHYQFSYDFSFERRGLFQDSVGIVFNRNTMSSGRLMVSDINVASLIDYQKPNEIKELSILGSYQIDATSVNVFSDLLADNEIQLEYYQKTPLLNLRPSSVKFMKINSDKHSFDPLSNNVIGQDSFWNTTLSIKDVKKFSFAVFG